MKLSIDQQSRQQARVPHELAMVNLLVFNLLLCAGILASTMARKGSVLEHYKWWLIVLPILFSLAVVAYTHLQVARPAENRGWFVTAHWRIARSRYRFLMIAYAVAMLLVGLGWLISLGNPALQTVMFVALIRVAVAPLLIAVMVLAVLESSALFQATSGELPDRWAENQPPAAKLSGPTVKHGLDD